MDAIIEALINARLWPDQIREIRPLIEVYAAERARQERDALREAQEQGRVASADLAYVAALRAHIAKLETHLGELLTDLAAREERETDPRNVLDAQRAIWEQDQQQIAALRRTIATMAEDHRRVRQLLERSEADAAEWEALYTAALVDLHRARADAAVLRELLWAEPVNFRRHCRICGRAEPNHGDICPLEGDHPGAGLLAELEAARGLVEALHARFAHGGSCPVCHQETPRHADGCALAAYDAARQARSGDGN